MTAPNLALSAPTGPEGAPLLVLGPSLGTASAELWSRAIPALSGHFRTATWDLPGHGNSSPAEASFDVADLADAVAHAVARTGENRFHYAGVSLGGAVGLQLALRHAGRVVGASVIASGARLGTSEGWHERASQVRLLGTSSVREQSAVRWFTPSFIAEHPRVADRLLDSLDAADDESYALCCEALAVHDVRGILGTVEVPIMVAWGEFDSVAPLELAVELTGALPRSTSVRIDGAAHLPPIERPEEVVSAMIGFHRGGYSPFDTAPDEALP